jgi:hypothetical protein
MERARWSGTTLLLCALCGCGGDGSATTAADHPDAEAGVPDSSLDAQPESVADTSVEQSPSMNGDAADVGLDAGDVVLDAPSMEDGKCAEKQWRDFEASTCRACPAPGVSCSSLSSTGHVSYDSAARTISLDIGPGRGEIVTALVSSSDCVQGIVLLTDEPKPVGNVITSEAPFGLTGSFCLRLKYSLGDRCGDAYKLTIDIFYDRGQNTTTILPCADGDDAAVD